MLYEKTGLPEEDELVMCKVTNIQYNSVFVKLTEYNQPGMIHISEISPGRIRNIRDYVKEGKTVVCKILRINKERNQIDLSLRRVTDAQRRIKVNSIKHEQISEKIIEFVAKKLGKNVEELYTLVRNAALKNYDSLYSCFEDVSYGNTTLEKQGIQKDAAKELTEVINQRIKIPEVRIEGTLGLSSYQPDGVDVVKAALMKAEKAGKDSVLIHYLGAGKYKILIKAEDYKQAEKILKNTVDSASSHMIANKGEASFDRK